MSTTKRTRHVNIRYFLVVNKLKNDETLWKCFISEDNSDKEIYGVNTFSSLEIKQDPSIFSTFPENQWTRASDKFKQLNKDYEISHNRWKKSGNHGNFGDFCYTNKCILYMHLYMEKNPHLLNIILSQLPAGFFSKSTNILPKPEKRKNRRNSSPMMSDASEDTFSSMSSKNQALEQKTIVVQGLQISNEIRTEKNIAVIYSMS